MRLPAPRPPLLAGLAVLALTLAAYAPSLSAGFVRWDDNITIYENPRLGDLDLERLRWAFTDVATTVRWIPLTLLSLSLTHTIHGLDPFGYHLASWLIHGAAAVALFLVLLELLGRGREDARGPWPAFAAAVGALTWSIHPARAEVVTWSNSRGHVQAGLFVLLSLLAYLRAVRPGAPRPGRILAWSAMAYLAALMSHPIAIGLAPVFVLLDVHLGRLGGADGWWGPAARRAWLEKLPFLAVAGAVLVVTFVARTWFSGRWEPPAPLSEWGVFARLVQAGNGWFRYVLVTAWPVDLFPAPAELVDFDPWAAPFIVRAAAAAALPVALALVWRRARTPLLLWAAHVSLVFPGLGLTEHPYFPCDRYTNLGALVPAAMAAWAVLALGAATAQRRVVAVAAALVVGTLGVLSGRQAATWRSSVTLFEHMLPLLGEHPFRIGIFSSLGWAHLEEGRPAEAVAPLQQAVLLAPWNVEFQVMLGEALSAAGRPAEAVEHLRRAAAAAPGSEGIPCALSTALARAGRHDEAAAVAREAYRQRRSPCAARLLLQPRDGRGP